MQLSSEDKVFQWNEGFIINRKNKIIQTDNKFRKIDEYNFGQVKFVTLDGLVVNRDNELLNLQNGNVKQFQHNLFTEGSRQYVAAHLDFQPYIQNINGQIVGFNEIDIYNPKNEDWVAYIDVKAEDGFVSYYRYSKIKTDIPDDFYKYYYINGISILVYHDLVKIYEGEIYSLERLEDYVHGYEEAYSDENYAQLKIIFEFDRDSIFSSFPGYILFNRHILDINSFDLYKHSLEPDSVIGIIDEQIITKKRRFNYKKPMLKINGIYEEELEFNFDY